MEVEVEAEVKVKNFWNLKLSAARGLERDYLTIIPQAIRITRNLIEY